MAARRGRAVKVLAHDELQDAQAFGRGRGAGVSVRSGQLQGSGVFESKVVESPFAFTHAGLHWKGSASPAIEVRTSADGVDWTEWQAPHMEAGPDDTPTGETFATLVAAPRHRFLQYQLSLDGRGGIATVTATFLNSVDGPEVETEDVGTTVAGPIDFSRGQWGADESLRFRGKREIWPRMFVPVKKLVVHHTVSSNDYADGAAEVRAIYHYHAVSLGWGDIGYNVLIDRFGFSYEGRYGRELSGGREVFSPDVVAGHASAHNYGSCGAAVIGSMHVASGGDLLNDEPRIVQRLTDVLEHIGRLREIDPAGSSHFLLSNDTWNLDLSNVSGHRDCVSTECPGQHLYDRLESIRMDLSDRLGMSASPEVQGPDGPPTQSTNSLAYSWGDGSQGALYSYYLEGWYKSTSSESITYLTGFTADRYPVWSQPVSDTSKTFVVDKDGRYTLHVRRHDGETTTTYQSSATKLISGLGSTSPGQGKGKKS
jgi:hypothetical protein